jgi:hypothetical protein
MQEQHKEAEILSSDNSLIYMVPGAGIEPARPFRRGILSYLRLSLRLLDSLLKTTR